jgi:hypothetical protein
MSAIQPASFATFRHPPEVRALTISTTTCCPDRPGDIRGGQIPDKWDGITTERFVDLLSSCEVSARVVSMTVWLQ